jgi:hypothetical protein
MSHLDITIRGLRVAKETPRRRSRRERLLEAFALLVLAALAADYSRARVRPIAVLGAVEDFGEQQVGVQSDTRTLSVRNAGRAALRVGGIGVAGDVAQAFFISEDSCSHAVLAPGAACSLGIAFLPRSQGPCHATLTIADNSSDSPHGVGLSGRGIGEVPHPPEPHAEAGIEPATVTLRAEVGGTATEPVTVRNVGDAPLNLLEVSFSGDRAAFAIDQSGCADLSIPPGGSCQLTASFTPLEAGPQAATVVVAHDAHNGPLVVSLEGQGIGPAEGWCCVGGQVLRADASACARQQGDFSFVPGELETRCAPPDTTPPPVPAPLQPGYPSEVEPQNLSGCAAVTLEWPAVQDPSQPVMYVLTLQNGRGAATDDRPTDWADLINREVVQEVRRDISSWLSPSGPDPRMVRPPMVGTKKTEKAQLLEERKLFVRRAVAFPEFRWRVSARDGAGNESALSAWMYLSCRVLVR